jgi:A/G-specific adenine glycosylase
MEGTNSAKVQQFRTNLGKWFEETARDLPWRRTRGLYQTVVSEFMLQQTQVKTMLPYFNRWMQQFPDFKALAKAGEETVVKAWEGLGYYNRARNLHKLSKAFILLPDPPQTPDEWQKLPGIGPYSSAAISSLAQGYPAAVVDGNVVRVLARIVANTRIFNSGAEAIETIRPVADTYLDTENPARHNEALMELGALICLKNNPACMICPVNTCCSAYKQGNADNIPNIQRKKIEKVILNRILILSPQGDVLLHKKPETEKRLANMHEFPRIEDIQIEKLEPPMIFKGSRGIANQRFEERFYEIELTEDLLNRIQSTPELKWINPDELEEITLSGPHRKWLPKILKTI